MYTQCPDCGTVFRVTADALRAAQGDVRCGVCSASFNALENLSEQSFKSAPATDDAPSPDDSMTVEELPGNENIELSSPPELELIEPLSRSEEDLAMEFHGDAADLEQLFVIEPPQPVSFDPATVAASLSIGDPPANDSDLDNTDEHPILVLDEHDQPVEPGESIVLEEQPPATAFSSARILIPDEMRKRLAEEAAARAALPSEFGPVESGEVRRHWPWAVGIVALLMLFGAQVVHSQREQLVRRPGLGPMIAEAYALFGLPLTVPTDLAAYELRQWGAANDPNEVDRLLLRASIINQATYAQPFPLLRLALQDRFGATLGVRDIEPKDYLPGAGGTGLLQPGERADALIRIVDPGQEAVGFEMDICVPAAGGVRCANQITSATQ